MIVKPTILIADDDIDDREIVRDALLIANPELNCVFIENGEHLLEHLRSDGEAALILLDLNMPGKDGREALKELKTDANLRTIPVIVFTTSSSPRDRNTAYELGANCFITKPDTFDALTDFARMILKLWL